LKEYQRTLTIHTDSRISIDVIAKPSDYQNPVEQIREKIRRINKEHSIIHVIGWREAHDGNRGNELADYLAKETACSGEAEIACIKIRKRAVISALKIKDAQGG
jgi:ribonuclease HI